MTLDYWRFLRRISEMFSYGAHFTDIRMLQLNYWQGFLCSYSAVNPLGGEHYSSSTVDQISYVM